MSKKLTSKKSPVKNSANTSELEHLEQVLQLMKRYGVNVLDVENDKGRTHLQVGVAHTNPAPSVSLVSQAPAPVLTQPTQASSAPAAMKGNQKEIKSPFVGTFYRSSNPASEPYCKEGQSVKKGQTLCIVEAMKLMNEIESEMNGKIISVLVENGQPVEFGEPLFIIEV
jgi:acetyl-CoA carboxylase biotin carboxyl carrier protein